MRIGDAVITLPTVRPKLYAGKVGTIAVRNEDEFGVLINGRVVWFLEREIEECQNGLSSSVNAGQGAKSANGQDGSLPLSQSTPRDARTSSGMGQGGAVNGRSAREANPGSPDCPVTNPSRAVPGSERESPPKPVSAPSRGPGEEQELILGTRGPGGGVVASCLACGGLWERARQRGRPSLKCPRCR